MEERKASAVRATGLDPRDAPNVQGYVLKTGQFLWKTSNLGDTNQVGEILTKQIETETFDYATDNLYAPPFEADYLIKCLEMSAVHFRSVQAKAQDVAAGYVIKRREGYESAKEAAGTHLENFFAACGDEETFIDVMQAALTDLEAIGWGALEVGRNLKGVPSKLWHIPGATVRVRKNVRGFVQKYWGKKRYFQKFPDKCALEKSGESVKISEWNLVDPSTGQKAREGVGPLDAANEIIFLRTYHPRSKIYGLPDFIPAVGAILGNIYARDYNLDFFSESMIPAWAIVVTGGSVDSETQTLIENYFKDLRAKGRSTLILAVPGTNVQIKFEKLETELQEGSFDKFTKNNRDEIMLAHGMFPARIGIIETAHLGAGTGTTQAENYKNSVVEPKQGRLEHMISNIFIKEGFLIEEWEFKFKEMDVRDRKLEAEINVKYVDSGILDPDEVREDIGKEPRAKRAEAETETEKMKVKGDPFGKALAQGIRAEMHVGLKRKWEDLALEASITHDEVEDLVAKIRGELSGVSLASLTKMSAEMPDIVSGELGVDFTPDEVDGMMTDVQGHFTDVADTAWLEDFATNLHEAIDMPEDIRAEKVEQVKGSMAARAGLYAGFAWGLANSFVVKGAEKANKEVWWTPTSKNPCVDCAAKEKGNPYAPGQLMQRPGDGNTLCRGNCHCFLEVK